MEFHLIIIWSTGAARSEFLEKDPFEVLIHCHYKLPQV